MHPKNRGEDGEHGPVYMAIERALWGARAGAAAVHAVGSLINASRSWAGRSGRGYGNCRRKIYRIAPNGEFPRHIQSTKTAYEIW